MLNPKVSEEFLGVTGPIGYLLRQAQHATRLKIERSLREYEITHPQFVILKKIAVAPEIHAANIARECLLSPQAVNMILKNLHTAGLVARTRHKIHGRVLRLSLTELGKKRLRQCKLKVAEIEKEMLEGLNPEEEKLIRVWLVRCAMDEIEENFGSLRSLDKHFLRIKKIQKSISPENI